MPAITPILRELLSPAYGPCPAFDAGCASMRWAPEAGHVPRGFFGATGAVSDVRLILVVAEPGDPHDGESHPASPPDAIIESTTGHAYRCFRDGRDLFHRNARHFLDLCFPGLTFDEQMRFTWITESVLCSAAKEGGVVPATVVAECRRRYLQPQMAAMQGAVIVALGGKAQARLRGLPGVVPAYSVAPPGCNHKPAEAAWLAAAAIMRERIGGRLPRAPGDHSE